MAMVVVDASCLKQADSQPQSDGLVWGSTAAWRCSTFIKWTEWTLAMTCGHDNSTINIVMDIIIIIIIIMLFIIVKLKTVELLLLQGEFHNLLRSIFKEYHCRHDNGHRCYIRTSSVPHGKLWLPKLHPVGAEGQRTPCKVPPDQGRDRKGCTFFCCPEKLRSRGPEGLRVRCGVTSQQIHLLRWVVLNLVFVRRLVAAFVQNM